MIRRVTLALAAAFLCCTSAVSQAALTTYSQNFESMVQSNPAALQADGWVVYGNVFTPANVYLYGYGTFPAPNGGPGFSAIDAGQGGVPQGAQQLSIYNDYNNADHGNGNLVEANVFREQTIAAADVGSQWVFQFDAKKGNLVSPSTALAFLKTVNPAAGYATTNFLTVNTTALPATWGTFTITIPITAGLVGQLMQFGFNSTATQYQASGIFYDNLSWAKAVSVGVDDTPLSTRLELASASPNPFTQSTRVDFTLATRGPAELAIYDIVGRRVATLFSGTAEAGVHSANWDGRTREGRLAPTGVYRCVLQTAAGRRARNLVLNH